jgi:hypothetical protein
MGKENFKDRTHPMNHGGRANLMRQMESVSIRLRDWRRESTAAHEGGHSVDREVLPQDQEIVLFEPLDRGEFDSDGNR